MEELTESNVKLIRFIGKHPFLSVFLILLALGLCMLGLGIGLTNIGIENSIKISDSFSTMTCGSLQKIPYLYSQWLTEYDGFLEYPSDFYKKWDKEMERCRK